MHPSMDELLALRDGDTVPEAEQHVARCYDCWVRLDQLRKTSRALRELPQLEAPANMWSVISDELDRRRIRGWTWRGVAAAAVILALLAGAGVGRAPRTERASVREFETDQQLQDLMEASRTLELVVQTRSHRSPVLRPFEAARIVVLEDRIAAIDAVLSATALEPNTSREMALWSGRVELLDELVHARGGALVREGFTHAAVNNERSRQ